MFPARCMLLRLRLGQLRLPRLRRRDRTGLVWRMGLVSAEVSKTVGLEKVVPCLGGGRAKESACLGRGREREAVVGSVIARKGGRRRNCHDCRESRIVCPLQGAGSLGSGSRDAARDGMMAAAAAAAAAGSPAAAGMASQRAGRTGCCRPLQAGRIPPNCTVRRESCWQRAGESERSWMDRRQWWVSGCG